MGIIDYHLMELEIALNKNDDRRILPDVRDSDRVVLDLGCGIGQSLIALDCKDRICIGIDVDETALRYGIENHGTDIRYVLCDAKEIPLSSRTVDLVYCRVSLPYMNIPKVVKEIRRVLRYGGRVWMTLHSRHVATVHLREALRSRNLRRVVHVMYVLMNGYILKYFGILVPFVNGRYESWQDTTAIKNLLVRSGFEVSVEVIGRHTVIEGCSPSAERDINRTFSRTASR